MHWEPETTDLHGRAVLIYQTMTLLFADTEDAATAGVRHDFVRHTIGIEHFKDQLNVLSQALTN